MTATETCGFPAGYFIIRSVACNRMLDVTMDEIEDGTEIVLWPEKDSSLVESGPFYVYEFDNGSEVSDSEAQSKCQ
jgi:hypothetical protein